MTQWIDRKYIGLLSNSLRQFKWKSPNLANCKCPFCEMDSTNHKARGYFKGVADYFFFYCHNCNTTMRISGFLKRINFPLYKSYRKEEIASLGQTHSAPQIAKPINKIDYSEAFYELKKLKTLSQLSHNHPAKIYAIQRRLPNLSHSFLRWAPSFMAWSNTLVPGKFEKRVLAYDEGRILIPFFDEHNKLFAYTGRAISENERRYILIVLNSDVPTLFGLNRLDIRRPILAVEGPLDSLFLPNCIALAGSNINELTYVNEPDKITVIFDNEPDKSETVKKIFHTIEHGYKVCIWPKWVQYKDINKMVENDWEPEYIYEVIRDNVFKGMEAKTRLKLWSEV